MLKDHHYCSYNGGGDVSTLRNCSDFQPCSTQKEKPILLTEGIYMYLKTKYWELSWAIKMKFCIYDKANNSIATKL